MLDMFSNQVVAGKEKTMRPLVKKCISLERQGTKCSGY